MRIGFVASFRDPNQADGWSSVAGYRRVAQLIQLLAPMHSIDLYVLGKRHWQPEVAGCTSISVLAAPSLAGQWLKLVRTYARGRRGTDLWVVYNPSLVQLPALLARSLCGMRIVIDYCDKQGLLDHRTSNIGSHIYLAAQRAAERLLVRHVEAFLVISTRLCDEVARVNPRARCLLYRGAFAPESVGEAPIELSPRSRYLLYLGSLYDFNGPDVLVRATRAAAQSHPNLQLLLVGPGPEEGRQRLLDLAREEGVGDRVQILGGLSDAQVFGLLREVDVLALPYLEHPRNRFNFPTKLFEYLWAGRPVIASRLGEMEQVLGDGKALLVPPGDVQAWASAIDSVLSDEGLRESLVAQSGATYSNQFAPDIVRRQVNDFLVSVCSR